MAQDPAFLFYAADFITGTMFFTDEQVGKYVRLMCAQKLSGHLSEDEFMQICKTNDEKILKKFVKDDRGLLYNKVLDQHINKRNAFSDSRRAAKQKTPDDAIKIYILKDNSSGYFKIASSVNPLRTFAELSGKGRDYSLIWTSDVMPRSKEDELHKIFAENKIKNNWYSLKFDDFELISKTYEGTYESNKNEHTFLRTLSRTENENEIVLDNKVFKVLEDKFVRDENFELSVLHFFDFNQTANPDKVKLIWEFCYSLKNKNQYDNFKSQFESYCELKKLTGFKHAFHNFLGKQEKEFLDGAWNLENWVQKLIDQKNNQNGRSANKSIITNRSVAIDGAAGEYNFGTL